ncbi:hypothetical protein DSO57_1021868 [Entomophthora muscae]|uniref:Uncharacterized protein n=1 Tax=Entomophthora muscae TaxID=34485 RepID=A0ACC2RUC2_9FUNG|nr:hypothetical protein DSO57_1021868 [Entomophthora muscae]
MRSIRRFKYIVYQHFSDMLPQILLEEVFSQLDRCQVYELRSLCLNFYRAALPWLFGIHSLKQTEDLDYISFLKKNGKHVRGLSIDSLENYQLLLDQGLSLSTVFPQLRSLRLSFSYPDAITKSMVADCLKLKCLKHLSTIDLISEPPTILFPVYDAIDSLYAKFCHLHILENWKLLKDLKKLFISSYSLRYDLLNTVQKSKEVPFEVIVVDSDYKYHLNLKNLNHVWLHYIDSDCQLSLRVPFGPEYMEYMESIGLNDGLSFSTTFLEEEAHVEKLLNIPDLVEHLTTKGRSEALSEFYHKPYTTSIPSICFCSDDDFCEPLVWQATKVSFEGYVNYETLFALANHSLPNLQELYITGIIPQEIFSSLQGSFPQLIHFFSKDCQMDCFWPKLLEAAPKLMFIHTDYIPPNVLDIEKQQSLLQFMPYQNIFGNSGYLDDLTEFNKDLFEPNK